MSTWNYRVIEKEYKDREGEITLYYEIHSVYYDDDGEFHAMSVKPAAMFGETPEELKSDYDKFGHAFNKPILKEKDL